MDYVKPGLLILVHFAGHLLIQTQPVIKTGILRVRKGAKRLSIALGVIRAKNIFVQNQELPAKG